MFSLIFQELRDLYVPFAPQAVVTADTPDHYWLGTHEVRARDGYRTAFGGVKIGKSYVSAHLMPLYVHTDMLQIPGPALRRRMQGKSCFNFRVADPILFAELGRVIGQSAARFAEDGRLRCPGS